MTPITQHRSHSVLQPRITKKPQRSSFCPLRVTCIAEPHTPTNSTVSKCPIAQASSFFANASTSILGRVGPPNANAHTFLAGGLSGQDVPGRLVSGLRPLRDVQGEFIVVTDDTYAHELTLKAQAFDTRRHEVFVAEPCSVDAQQEALEIIIDALVELGRARWIDQGVLCLVMGDSDPGDDPTTVYKLSDYASAPLELAARLVQEDLVLMRPPQSPQQHATTPTPQETPPPRYCMTAAAVVFSFGELEAKLGAGMPFIHAPVPGFEKDLDRLLSKTFDKLQVDKPGGWGWGWFVVVGGGGLLLVVGVVFVGGGGSLWWCVSFFLLSFFQRCSCVC